MRTVKGRRKETRTKKERPSNNDIGSGKNKKVVVTIKDIPKQQTSRLGEVLGVWGYHI